MRLSLWSACESFFRVSMRVHMSTVRVFCLVDTQDTLMLMSLPAHTQRDDGIESFTLIFKVSWYTVHATPERPKGSSRCIKALVTDRL